MERQDTGLPAPSYLQSSGERQRQSENLFLDGHNKSSLNSSVYETQDDSQPMASADDDLVDKPTTEGSCLMATASGDFGGERRVGGKTESDTKMTVYLYLLSFFAAIGGFLFGYDTGVVSGAMLYVDLYYDGLTDLQQEMIVSVTIGAAAVGAALGGNINEWLGRKKTLILASFVFTVGAVCMASSPPKYWQVLFVGRLIVGIGIGFASMTVPVYIAECAPSGLRGKLVVVNSLFITGGQAAAATIDGAFGGLRDSGWRYMLGLAGVPSVVMFFGFMFMPESPRWLLRKGHPEQARETLRKIRGTPNVDKELMDIEKMFKQEEEEEGKESFWAKTKRMFTTPSVRRAVIVGCGLQAIQQLAGINTVMYYSATIIRMAGEKNERNALWYSALVATGNMVFTSVGICLVERLGRRKLLLASLFGVFLCLGFLSGGFWYAKSQGPPDLRFANFSEDGSKCQYPRCDTCILNSDCGFCFHNESSKPVEGTCQHISSETKFKSRTGDPNEGGQVCSLADALIYDNKTTWAFDYCPVNNAWIIVVALVCYIAAFAPGMGPMPWTINSEIYPNWARSTGTSYATAVNWICNLAISMSFLTLSNNEYIGRQGAFLIYAFFALLGLIFVYAFVPETRGKKLEEVEKLFERPWCERCCAGRDGYERLGGVET